MQPSLIERITNEIEENLAYSLSVATLSERVGISPWHFQRLFKAAINDSLGNYIRGRRLTRAAHLLLQSDLTIIQIAFDVGFNSHEALTRSFRDYFNMTPKAFRANKKALITQEKPRLNQTLYKHIANNIAKTPAIEHNKELHLIGYKGSVPSLFTAQEDICASLSTLWFKLFEHQDLINNRVPKSFCSLYLSPSGNFDEPELDYFAAAVVKRINDVPHGMQSYSIAANTYASFNTQTNIGSDETKHTVEYIYGYWLCNSGFQRALGSDFELFTEVNDFATGDFKSAYCLPITPTQG